MLNEFYLDIFDVEELEVIFEGWFENNENISKLNKKRIWFPLLREVAKLGNQKALSILREEMIIRINRKKLEDIEYFLNENFLHLFELEELIHFYEEIDIKHQSVLKKINSLINQKRIVNNLKKHKRIKIVLEDRYKDIKYTF